jgi:hypothetical protein
MAFPVIDACFLCELARPESNGKFTILGYYGVAPYVHIYLQNFNLPAQLCFVFAGGSGQGHFRIDLKITAPNGATFDAQGAEGDIKPQGTVTNVFMSFAGVLPGPGNYTATFLVNGAQHFQTTFFLEQNPPPAPGTQIN